MELRLSKNKKFLYLTERPKRDVKGGIMIWFKYGHNPQTELPVAYTDIEKGKIRYDLPDHQQEDFNVYKYELV